MTAEQPTGRLASHARDEGRWGDDGSDLQVVSRLLIEEWERIEGPVNPGYVANFADMARAILASSWLADLLAAARESGISRGAAMLIMAVFTVYFLLPLWWLLVAASKDNSDILTTAPLWFSRRPDVQFSSRPWIRHEDDAGMVEATPRNAE